MKLQYVQNLLRLSNTIHEHTFHRIFENISWKCILTRYLKTINLKVYLIFSLQIIKFPSIEETYNVACILTFHVESQHNMEVQQVYVKVAWGA